jgi:hypothetical protein
MLDGLTQKNSASSSTVSKSDSSSCCAISAIGLSYFQSGANLARSSLTSTSNWKKLCRSGGFDQQ